MITILHTIIILGLVILPLLKVTKKSGKPVVYKNDRDTSDADYAVNDHGFLEEIARKKVSGQVMD